MESVTVTVLHFFYKDLKSFNSREVGYTMLFSSWSYRYTISHVVARTAKTGANNYNTAHCTGDLQKSAKYTEDNEAYRKRKQAEGTNS